MFRRVYLSVLAVSLIACTKKSQNTEMVDDTPVQEKSFEVSGSAIGYGQFDSYLCFQLVGGLFMVRNQYYRQKLPNLKKEDDRSRVQALVERTNKIRVLMESKTKEVAQIRKNEELPYEERSKKVVETLAGAFESLKHIEPGISELCQQKAQSIKDKCFRMKDQSAFSQCYDDMGKSLNKEVLTYFNSQLAK